MSNLKFGWAEVDLTPDKKVALAGQFAERISQYVEKPITATAMAVSSEEEQMILVSCDLVSIGYNLLEDIRKNLADNTVGIDPMKVVISAIHTHTGPVYPRVGRMKITTSFRKMLEQFLPEGKKYIEKEISYEYRKRN